MANIENRNSQNQTVEIENVGNAKTEAVRRQSETAYDLPTRLVHVSLDASKARYGIMIGEVLGPPVSRRRGRGRWI